MIDTLKPLGGKPYDLTIPPMMESGSFLDNQLVSILKDSGWELRTIKGNVEKAQIPFGLWMFAGNPPDKVSQEDLKDTSRLTDIEVGITHDVVGVRILYDATKSPDFAKPVVTLSRELNRFGIGGSPGHAPASNGMANNVIHVIIGRK